MSLFASLPALFWANVQLLFIYWGLNAVYLPINFFMHKTKPQRSLVLAWDNKMPYWPSFYLPYLAGLGFIVGGPLLFAWLLHPKEFLFFIVGLMGVMVVSLLTWFFYPCRIQKSEEIEQGPHFFLVRIVLSYGKNGGNYNSFPSSHVSLITYMLLWLGLIFPSFMIVFLLLALINAMSILLTHQHYILDAIAGWGLAVVMFLAAVMFPTL